MAVAQMVWGAQERAKLLTNMRLAMTFLTLLVTFGLLLGTNLGVLSVYIAQAVSPTLLLWVHMRFAWKNFGFAWDSKAIQRALAFGLPMVIHLTSHWALDTADRFLLDHYLGREAVGVYTVAYGTMSTLLTVNDSINSAYVPQFIRARGTPGGDSFIAKSITYFWLSILAATLGFVIFAPLVIRTLYSDRFASAAPLAPLLALGAPLHAVYLVYVNALFHANKTRMIPVLTLTAGFANIGLNILLITQLRLLGAVLATIAGYAMLAILFRIWAAVSTRPILLEKSRLLRVVVVFWAIAIPAYLLDGHFSLPIEIVLKVILALSAPLLLLASKFATEEELTALQNRLPTIRRDSSV
jgi:O-antigen/teichoic acid export membrane protein